LRWESESSLIYSTTDLNDDKGPDAINLTLFYMSIYGTKTAEEMGKKAKEHRKKVAKRNAEIKLFNKKVIAVKLLTSMKEQELRKKLNEIRQDDLNESVTFSQE
jgi:hypothetical protein